MTRSKDRKIAETQQSVEALRAALCEIANRASNFADDDAAEWMPSIYTLACEAIGEDPMPALKATGFDGDVKDWPTRKRSSGPSQTA